MNAIVDLAYRYIHRRRRGRLIIALALPVYFAICILAVAVGFLWNTGSRIARYFRTTGFSSNADDQPMWSAERLN